MIKFQQKFSVHAAGQGLFYSGIIKLNLRYGSIPDFKFVFDCGSFNYKNCSEEVELYRDLYLKENNIIDLLVISHFDADHINHLKQLLDGVTVKKIVAPFINFEERLFLALRLIQQGYNPPDPDDDTLAVIIDPVGTLGRYLDEGGGFILVKSDFENPPFKPDEFSQESSELLSGSVLEFNFESSLQVIEDSESTNYKTTQPEKIKTTFDSNPGFIKIGHIRIMDFLFYRSSVGANEKEFYKEVLNLFVEKYQKEFIDPAKPELEEIIEIIKNNSSARVISEIFQKAAKNVSISYSKSKIANLNSTALSLLHLNNPNFYRTLYRIDNDFVKVHCNVMAIRKLDGTSKTKITSPLNCDWCCQCYYNYKIEKEYLADNNYFPNSLLTSDSFLLNQPDIDAFYNRYCRYWNSYWLFQIPHHGSKCNSDRNLFLRISTNVFNFINFGVIKTWGGRWRHPSPEVINDLVLTGHSCKIIQINEFQGLEIRFEIRK